MLACAFLSHCVVQFESSAILLRAARPVARGSRTTLPRAYAMTGRVVMHTCVANTLSCLSLSFCCRKTESWRRNWSADQVFWQADHLLWFPPQKVVGSWSLLPISWSAAFPQFPGVEFHLSGALCKFLKSIANKGKPGHSDGFPEKATRACMHPLSFNAELSQSTFI